MADARFYVPQLRFGRRGIKTFGESCQWLTIYPWPFWETQIREESGLGAGRVLIRRWAQKLCARVLMIEISKKNDHGLYGMCGFRAPYPLLQYRVFATPTSDSLPHGQNCFSRRVVSKSDFQVAVPLRIFFLIFARRVLRKRSTAFFSEIFLDLGA